MKKLKRQAKKTILKNIYIKNSKFRNAKTEIIARNKQLYDNVTYKYNMYGKPTAQLAYSKYIWSLDEHVTLWLGVTICNFNRYKCTSFQFIT